MAKSSAHVKLGERGFHLFANEYNGEPKIHIRKLYEDPVDGKITFTKFGVTLNTNEWNNLKDGINTIDIQLMQLSQQTSKRKAQKSSRARAKPYAYQPYQTISREQAPLQQNFNNSIQAIPTQFVSA